MILKSSNVKAVDYNESTEIMVVEFVGGGKYKYFSVPAQVYKGLISAESPGTYLSNFIKGKFNFKKL